MRSPKLLDFLVLGLSVLSVTEATVVNFSGGRLHVHNGVAIQRRQSGTGTPSDPTSSSSSTTPVPTPSSTPSTPTSTPSATPTPTPTRSSSSSSSSTSQSSSGTTPTTTPAPNTSSTTQPPEITTSTTIITTTGSDGQSTVITSATTFTPTPGLANNGNSGAQPGMSPQTRNTVIGVVVGVGGAIILGGLGFVAWRIWGRKKAVEENDDLDYPSTAGGEKPDTGNSMSGRTPFQSTLESYHAPTQVNTASNF